MINFTHFLGDLVDDQWHIDPKKFQPNMVINGASEHYGNGMLEVLAQALTNDSTVYSHDPDDHLKLPNLKFYPYWYHWSKQNWPQTHRENIAQDRKQYSVSCLNNSSHPHRIINWFALRDRKDILITMRNDTKNNANNITLTEQEQEQWNIERKKLEPRKQFSQEGKRVDADILHEAYTNSYVNLVTETVTCPKVFITEKTWKPIASGQLFMILGDPGTIEHLREQGIDCFDDIIDHNYDAIEDTRERIAELHRSLDKLLKQDLYNINLLTKQRRTKNAELFWSNKLYYEL